MFPRRYHYDNDDEEDEKKVVSYVSAMATKRSIAGVKNIGSKRRKKGNADTSLRERIKK